MDKYCYNGLLWLAQGEDVNIYDAESGDLLVEDFTLTERKDTIELPIGYVKSSPYYMDSTSDKVTFGGRDYPKANTIPSYGTAYHRSDNWTCPMFISMDPNGVKGTGYAPSGDYAGTVEFNGATWYISGPGAALTGDYSNSASPTLASWTYGSFAKKNVGRGDYSEEAALKLLQIIYAS